MMVEKVVIMRMKELYEGLAKVEVVHSHAVVYMSVECAAVERCYDCG